MMLLMQLTALVPTTVVLLAAGTLVTMGLRVERRVAANQMTTRMTEQAPLVLQAVADSRAPGRSLVRLASGVAVRVVRAEGTVCRRDDAVTLSLRRGMQVRTPIVGDSLLVADTAAADGWQASPIAAVTSTNCADGTPAWRLSLGVAPAVPLDEEGLIIEWLEFSVSSGPAATLLARPAGAAAARQPVLDLHPGGARLTLLDSIGVELGVGALRPTILELRHGVADTIRIRVDGPGGA
jgi:hypothetical protein